MVLDQMYAWNGAPRWLTMLGRSVFPIFLFAAAESFHYTRDRKAYLRRLLFACWGMTLFTAALSVLGLVPERHQAVETAADRQKPPFLPASHCVRNSYTSRGNAVGQGKTSLPLRPSCEPQKIPQQLVLHY